jgi:nucleoside 2-deoxyribosyltransferase
MRQSESGDSVNPKDVGLIYIAAPYINGDCVENTHRAVKAWEKLTSAGYVAHVPHINLLLHIINPRPASFWYEYDFEILKRCDAVVRLSGKSSGADAEVEYAMAHGMPVYTMSDLIQKDKPEFGRGKVAVRDRHRVTNVPSDGHTEYVVGQL